MSDLNLQELQAMMADLLQPITDVRASAEYRLAMAQSMLLRALQACAGVEMPLVTELKLNE